MPTLRSSMHLLFRLAYGRLLRPGMGTARRGQGVGLQLVRAAAIRRSSTASDGLKPNCRTNNYK